MKLKAAEDVWTTMLDNMGPILLTFVRQTSHAKLTNFPQKSLKLRCQGLNIFQLAKANGWGHIAVVQNRGFK